MKIIKTPKGRQLLVNSSERFILCKIISGDDVDMLSQVMPVELDLNKSFVGRYFYDIVDEQKFLLMVIKHSLSFQY